MKKLLIIVTVFLIPHIAMCQINYRGQGSILSIAIDSKGDKWIGYSGGLAKFNGTTWDILTDHINGYNVKAIAIDKNKNVWIGKNNGVVKFDGINWVDYSDKLENSQVNDIVVDQNSNIWFATEYGVYKFNDSSWERYLQGNGLISNQVVSVAVDNDNNLWFGTGSGISKFDGIANWKTYDTKYPPTGNLFFSNGALLAAFPNSIKKYNPITNIFEDYIYNYIDNQAGNFNCIAKGLDGNIYVASQCGGLLKFTSNNTNSQYRKFINDCTGSYTSCIAIDVDGIIWFGSSNGVLVSLKNEIITEYKPNNLGLLEDMTFCVAIDKNNIKWFGTRLGISSFDGSKWLNYSIPIPTYIGWVTSIVIDKNNHIWFDDADNGIGYYDGASLKRYTTSDGLLNNKITCLAIDSSNSLWVGHENGASKFNANSWTTYSTSSGLVGTKINDIDIDPNGNVIFSTSGGVSIYDGNKFLNYTNYNTNSSLWATEVYHTFVEASNKYLFVGNSSYISEYSNGVWNPSQNDIFSQRYSSLYGGDYNGNQDMSSIIVTPDKNIWKGYKGNKTYGGLFNMYDKGSTSRDLNMYQTNSYNGETLNYIAISDFKLDHKNDMWITTGNSSTQKANGVYMLLNKSSDQTTDIQDPLYSNTINVVTVYPNPAKDILTIVVNKPSSTYSIKFFDTQGSEVYSQLINTSLLQINLNNLTTKGLYLIKVLDNTNNVLETKKLILE